jgi:hypothetical protein
MAQFAHRPGLDLADALACQIEVLTHLYQRPRLTPVEPEAEPEDLPLALVERSQQTSERRWEQCRRGELERALGRAVLDEIADLGVAIFAHRLRQRQRLGGEAQHPDDLGLGHRDLAGELGERRRAAVLELQARLLLL